MTSLGAPKGRPFRWRERDGEPECWLEAFAQVFTHPLVGLATLIVCLLNTVLLLWR